MLCFLYLQCEVAIAQDQRIADSLVNIYQQNNLQDTLKYELLRKLAFNEVNNLQLSLKYAEELIALSNLKGNALYLYRGYLQKGNSNKRLGDLEIALEAYFNSLKAAKKADFIAGEGVANMAIADIYSLKGNSSTAEAYYDKAIELLRKTNDSNSLATALSNAGDEYFKTKNYDTALHYFEEAGIIFKKANSTIGIAYYLGSVGMVYAAQGKEELAKKNLKEAITMLEEIQDYYGISAFLNYLAAIYARQNDLPSALRSAKRSLELATNYGFKEQISAANLQLSKLYEQAGNFAESYKYFRNHIAYRDSLNNIKSVQETANLRTNYEVSQKQAEVDLLEKESEIQQLKAKRQRNLNYASVIALVLIVLMAFGLYQRYNFIKKTNRIIEEEKNRSEKLLRNILPDETALELKQKGRVKAKKFESVTVLFTDFKDFTHSSSNLTPENLVRSVDYYFSRFDEVMDKHGLEKIKTMGDAYMCAGGLHFHKADHALKMVQAAFEIVQIMDESKKIGEENIMPYDIRIGIHTGPVVAGVVGTRKFAYDIWGDTVNVASRMESSSEPGKINISERTYLLIKDNYDCSYRGELEVKNKGMMKMYFVN
ncbi:MAG: tetratricopeptide repeat protein, partial [Maribacter sp.]|nr:tetratricopeptide repeat protein [Maribacter sp.]